MLGVVTLIRSPSWIRDSRTPIRAEPRSWCGAALCKLHHAAFDRNFIGIRPDRVIQLREDIRQEGDGPMLEYGIQAFHDQPLWVPKKAELKPDAERLEERYGMFLASA